MGFHIGNVEALLTAIDMTVSATIATVVQQQIMGIVNSELLSFDGSV